MKYIDPILREGNDVIHRTEPFFHVPIYLNYSKYKNYSFYKILSQRTKIYVYMFLLLQKLKPIV